MLGASNSIGAKELLLVIFYFLTLEKPKGWPQKSEVVIPFLLKSRFLVPSKWGEWILEAQPRFGGDVGVQWNICSFRPGGGFCLPKMDIMREFSVSLGRTCGSSPQLFLRRGSDECSRIWKHRSLWTQTKYRPQNNEPLSECTWLPEWLLSQPTFQWLNQATGSEPK